MIGNLYKNCFFGVEEMKVCFEQDQESVGGEKLRTVEFLWC